MFNKLTTKSNLPREGMTVSFAVGQAVDGSARSYRELTYTRLDGVLSLDYLVELDAAMKVQPAHVPYTFRVVVLEMPSIDNSWVYENVCGSIIPTVMRITQFGGQRDTIHWLPGNASPVIPMERHDGCRDPFEPLCAAIVFYQSGPATVWSPQG